MTTPTATAVRCWSPCCKRPIGHVEREAGLVYLTPMDTRDVRYHRRNDGAYREVARGGRLERAMLPLPAILVCPSCGRLNIVSAE